MNRLPHQVQPPFDLSRSDIIVDGDGELWFLEVNVAPGMTETSLFPQALTAADVSLGAVTADFDNDGWPDIYVACDSTPSFLFRNNHDGTFSEVALENGVALNEDGMEQGMGGEPYAPRGEPYQPREQQPYQPREQRFQPRTGFVASDDGKK